MAYIPPNPNGAATTANSQPVNIASDQTVPVSLATDLDTSSTGTLAAAAQTVVLSMASKSAASVIVTGTWVGTITFEGTVDGTTWSSINAVAATTSQPQPTTTVNGLYRLSPAGLLQMRANMTAFTSGSASIGMRASVGTGGVFVNQILPSKITDGISTAAIKAASTPAVAADPALVIQLSPMNAQAASLIVSTTGAASAAVTATLPAAGAGLFHYIVRINIIKYASVATVGAAAPTIVTTTNMSGSLAWTTPTALAVGTQYETDINSSAPIKSSVANTATTIVCPLTTSIIWRVNVYYYTAP